MQRRALSLLTRQRPYSQTPEEDEAVLDQWLHRKSMGYICKSTPYEWLMRWFPRCEIDASTVHLYMGQLNDEIQAHQRLPTGFMGLIKLLIGWWHDIAGKQQILTQYNVIMQSIAQHSPSGRRPPELAASPDHQGELTLRINPPAIGSSLDWLDQQNGMIMHAAYTLGNSLRHIDAAQRQQQVKIDHLILEQEARSREQQALRQNDQARAKQLETQAGQLRAQAEQLETQAEQITTLKAQMITAKQSAAASQQAIAALQQAIAAFQQAVAQMQADQPPRAEGRRRPSFATVHGVFAAEEEEYTPSTSAAAQPAARRLSSAKTG